MRDCEMRLEDVQCGKDVYSLARARKSMLTHFKIGAAEHLDLTKCYLIGKTQGPWRNLDLLAWDAKARDQQIVEVN